MLLSDPFLIFLVRVEIGRNQWSNATEIVRKGNELKTSLPEMENELPEEWITFAHSHRVERASARARSELSASLGPVSGKSNYSKRDRKLLRSRSSLSIYTVCSDQGSWGGNVQRASGSPTSSYPSRRGRSRDGGIHIRTTRSFSLILEPNGSLRFQLFLYASLTFLLSLYLFHPKFGWCSCVREYESFVSCIRRHAVGNIADNF